MTNNNTIQLEQVTKEEKEVTLIRPDGNPCIMRESRAKIALTRNGWKKFDSAEKKKLVEIRNQNLKKAPSQENKMKDLEKKIDQLTNKK